VIDVEGRPVAELELGFAPLGPDRTPRESEARTSLGRSAADGSFELTVPGPGRLFARDERWVTVLSGLPVAAERAPRAYVVVAPRLELSGLVVDEGGAPLANVSVVLAPPSDLRARLSVVLDFSDPQEFVAVSDDAGRFRIERAPLLRDGTLSARVSGRIPFRESSPVSSRHDLVLVLPREENSNERLRGLVLGPRGEPLPDARVAYGLDTVHTDAEGRFEFDLHDERSMNRRARAWVTVPDDRLTALLPGFLPGEVVAERRDSEGQPLWPDPLVIRLDGTPLALAGRVVDERGTGLSGIRVWLADGTFFGAVRPEGQRDYPDFAEVEGLLAGAEPGWNYATTGADGAFRLEGLLVRDYALAAMDTSSLLRTVTEGLAAGREDIELVLDTGRLLRLAGLVVDGRGEPVSGVSIFPMCDAFEAKVAGQTIGTTHEAAPGVVTGADGRFALERVPATLAYLRLQGSETLPLEWGRGLAGGLEELADGRAEDLCITLERRCHFRIELVDPSQADECAMVDEDGRELVISDFQGASRNDTERHALLGGRSNTLAVSDRARELVLYLGGVAVRRVPVTLLPGEPLVLTP
jgi:protocatechuate 3,4-dioxygenase beta subunit